MRDQPRRERASLRLKQFLTFAIEAFLSASVGQMVSRVRLQSLIVVFAETVHERSQSMLVDCIGCTLSAKPLITLHGGQI